MLSRIRVSPKDSVGREFHFPYRPPYKIQTQFMNAVYDCIENGHVGILESPTGTGKSLSLICGSLTWLRDFKRKSLQSNVQDDVEEDEPSWMSRYAQDEKIKEVRQRQGDLNRRLALVRGKEDRARARLEDGAPPRKRIRTSTNDQDPQEDGESQFVLEDYESSDENRGPSATARRNPTPYLSTETQALLDKFGGPSKSSNASGSLLDHDDELKVFFCSRTHSQLAQFVGELQRVRMPSSLPSEERIDGSDPTDASLETIKHLSLGSRRNLCINDKVLKLQDLTAINERCLEIQQPETPQEARCRFLPGKENEMLVNDFRDHALAKVSDIEDLGRIGKRIGVCPYYATRNVIRPSEIVTLPYPLLLQKTAREALNLSLRDHVVIIDEAHNLMDTISNIHSVSLSFDQLQQSRTRLGVYLQKFRNRLKGKNRVYVTQLVRLIDSMIEYLDRSSASVHVSDQVVNISELMSGKGVDQINLHKLMHYLKESRLARKVEGYHDHAQQHAFPSEDDKSEKKMPSTPALSVVSNFLLALTNPAPEGKFFFSRDDQGRKRQPKPVLKYMLLDPSFHFKEVVDEARAVILAGGTMSPMSDYRNNLFHYLPPERIHTLSCNHVIPASNLSVIPIARGPSSVEFDFTFEKRDSDAMMTELGNSVFQLCRTIPDGVVVFFPSYRHLASAVQSWQKDHVAPGQTLWGKLRSVKRIFMEPASYKHISLPNADLDTSLSTVDAVLDVYDKHINSSATSDAKSNSANTKGAVLFAVISGSLSEGINFADRLGRGVIVIGLPFPNPHTAEWNAKLQFIEKHATHQHQTTGLEGSDETKAVTSKGNIASSPSAASREYYENCCMRAVNQSIGRAIRHKDDYAAIVLLDRRYTSARIQGKLPGWIRSSMTSGGSSSLSECNLADLRTFFNARKEA